MVKWANIKVNAPQIGAIYLNLGVILLISQANPAFALHFIYLHGICVKISANSFICAANAAKCPVLT